MGWDEVIDLFGGLAATGGQLVVDVWVAICMAVWGAGLWVFRMVLLIGEWLLTPSLAVSNPDGTPAPLHYAFGVTLWLALMLALLLTIVNLIVAVIRRDGRSLAQLLLGAAGFLLVCVAGMGYAAAAITAVAGLNQALMRQLFGITSMRDLKVPGFDIAEAAVSGTVATVLLALGLVLWLAALSYLVVLLGRSVALVVLAATAPIAAAGLLYEPLKAWFWKAFRWFHAAAVAPLLMTLMLGTGTQIADGIAFGAADDAQAAVGTAVPAVVMILVASWSPLALFRMLAFVDPGTTSGANFRASLHPARAAGTGLDQLTGQVTNTGSGSMQQPGPEAESGNPAPQQRATTAQTSSLGTPPPSVSPGGTAAAPSGGAAAGGSAGGGSAGGMAGGTAAQAGATGGGAGAAAGGGAAGAGGGVAGGGAAGGVAGVLAVGALMGAAALASAFRSAGAAATGVVSDTVSGIGAGDLSYPYDPQSDAERRWRHGHKAGSPPVAVIQQQEDQQEGGDR